MMHNHQPVRRTSGAKAIAIDLQRKFMRSWWLLLLAATLFTMCAMSVHLILGH